MPMKMSKLDSLRHAIDNAIRAIGDSQKQVESIARSTMDEVERLELEYEQLKTECLEAITTVEQFERNLREARNNLMKVNRNIRTYSEQDMQQAYQKAEHAQAEVTMWRERENQLRLRRDGVARRLKSLRATAREAEILLIKFQQMTGYLGQEFQDASSAIDIAKAQLLLGMRMLQIHEEERRNIAQRLHDGAMQSLASMAIQIQSSQTDSISFRTEVRQDLNNVISDLRTLVFDLRPPLLDDLGLVPTLKRYAEQWANESGIKVKSNLVGLEVSLSSTEKVTVFRAIQEGLRNISQHANASEVVMNLVYSPDKLEVQLMDDGIGVQTVDWQEFAQSGRVGLIICKERLGAIGGTLELKPTVVENPKRTGHGAKSTNDTVQGSKLIVTIPAGREMN
jgi:two-component system, NarL family, sensor histidine kinase DegS